MGNFEGVVGVVLFAVSDFNLVSASLVSALLESHFGSVISGDRYWIELQIESIRNLILFSLLI